MDNMNNMPFLENEKNHSVSTAIQFLFDTLNKGSIIAIDDVIYNETVNLISQNYENKEIIKNVLLYNCQMIRDTAWQLHLQYFTQNLKSH